MAVVQYTAIVNQIRGKLNGSVFNKSRTAFTLQSKQMPPKGASQSQLNDRVKFGQVQRTWKTITPAQKADAATLAASHAVRNRLGELVYISGYNFWMRANLFRVSIGLPILNALSTSQVSTYVFTDVLVQTLQDISIGSSQRLRFQFRMTVAINSLVGLTFSIYVSPPVSTGITKYYGNYLLIDSGTLAGNFGTGNFFTYFSEIILPPGAPSYQPGQTVWVKVLFYTPSNGITYQEYSFQRVLT